MNGAERKFDENHIETMLFSREKPSLSQELRENTLFTLSKLKEQHALEESAQRKVYKNILAVFSILIFLFGVLIAQNIHFFESFYLLVRSFAGSVSIERFLNYGKYVVISLAAMPAIIFAISEARKKHAHKHID